MSWTFGFVCDEKGTRYGFGGDVKSRCEFFFKVNDAFLANKFQVFEALKDLFAGPKARGNYLCKPKNGIKIWEVLWVDNAEIFRPAQEKIRKEMIEKHFMELVLEVFLFTKLNIGVVYDLT